METTIPVRQTIKKIEEIVTPEAEQRLVAYCEEQISKMSRYAALNNAEGQLGFYELNRALSEYQNINLSLIGIEVLAKNEHARAIEAFEEWYADKYITEREILNPRSMSTTKWYAAKEIEMQVRTKHKADYTRLNNERIYAEHKVAMLRRMLDSWTAHQFVLARLSKNVEAELGGSKLEDSF